MYHFLTNFLAMYELEDYLYENLMRNVNLLFYFIPLNYFIIQKQFINFVILCYILFNYITIQKYVYLEEWKDSL